MIHRLHQKYGPVVRIAPNELSFSDKSVAQQLYSQTTEFIKASRYDNFMIPPISVFVMRNIQQVRERRRYLSFVFSWSYLRTIEPVIRQNLKLLNDVIDQSIGKPLPVLYWFRLLALDIIGWSSIAATDVRRIKLWGFFWCIEVRMCPRLSSGQWWLFPACKS